MAEEYFNEYFHPELASVAIKGEYLEAVADMLDASATNLEHIDNIARSLDENDRTAAENNLVKAFRKIAEVFRHDGAKQHGVSIEDVPALLAKYTQNEQMDAAELLEKLHNNEIDIANLSDLNSIIDQVTVANIKNFMSYAVTSQEQNPQALTDLIDAKTKDSQRLYDAKAYVDQQVELIIEQANEEGLDKDKEVNTLKKILVVNGLTIVASMSKVAAAINQANPVREAMDRVAENIKLHVNEHLGYILGIDTDTHVGKIEMANLYKDAKQMMTELGLTAPSKDRLDS